MAKNGIRSYCAKVGRGLLCAPETKKKLLNGLREELLDLPEESAVSVEALEECYGRISYVTAELQQCISGEESANAFRRKRKAYGICIGVAAAAALLALGFVVLYIQHAPSYVIIDAAVECA